MKKNVIITSIDYHYGNFFLNHWLKSLTTNVDLTDIDVVVLDYGLTPYQKKKLLQQNIILINCLSSGHIVNKRFTDAAKFLTANNYDQVLLVDGGDIIFQEDIAPLFNKDRSTFRAVALDLDVLFYEAFIPFNFGWKNGKRIYDFLIKKPVLNAGFILGPRKKFVEICIKMEKLIANKHAYGPDQVALNYYLYKYKVKLLDKKYNFMIGTVKEGFTIKNGLFYTKNGGKIAVIHNAGHNRYLRPMKNFGYGLKTNKLNKFTYYFRLVFYSTLGAIKKLISK